MKKNKTPVEIQAPSLAEFVAEVARALRAVSPSGAEDKRLLMESGFSEEVAFGISAGVRGIGGAGRTLDSEVRPGTTAERLDRVYEDLRRKGDEVAAARVLRERNRSPFNEDRVPPLSDRIRTRLPRTASQEALEELGPTGRWQFDQECRQRLFELTGRHPNGSKPASETTEAKSAAGRVRTD